MTLLDTLPPDATLRDAVVAAVTRAAAHNPNDAVAPAVILWTDKERQWEGLLPELRHHLPLLTLGPYMLEERSGPAFWLRCAVAGVLDSPPVPVGATPVIYMPGVSRSDLRAVESCPKDLQPLAELQYRGVFWSHSNGRDWTVAGFLQSPNGGLGIAIQEGAATENALQMGLEVLAREPLSSLMRAQPLGAAYIHELLTPDPGRLLLHWLNDPEGTRATLSTEAWEAFLAVCRDVYNFRPEQDGPITGTRKLGQRKGAWARVWDLFREQPERYSGVVALLANEKPAQLSLFEEPPYGGDEDPRSPWPRENERAEVALQQDLRTLTGMTAPTSRERVRELEVHHAGRRKWVWARLGQAPLTLTLEHLADLAMRTGAPITGLSTAEIVSLYADSGWRTDLAMLRALAATAGMAPDDEAAVRTAATALYRDWLEGAATAFQQAVTGVDALNYPADAVPETGEGTCLLFVDGLRFDLGMVLAELLQAKGLEPSVTPCLAALPPVTSTAKPAVSPVARLLTGNGGLETLIASVGQKVNATVLHKQITAAGFQVLRGDEAGDPAGRAWTEQGEIDKYGHNHGLRVAEHGLQEVERLAQRIGYLLAAGWREVIVVTDHGWLLLPGGLPTATLPEHLTEVRKGRCARLKDGSTTDATTVPWHWDPEVRIAVAPGIRCYEAGKVYEHGGLSPQECIAPVITIRKAQAVVGVQIEQATWRGLRCRITLTGASKAMTVDLRTSAADPASSVADTPKVPDPDGTTTLFLHGDRDDLVGSAAWIVVTGEDGALLAQQQTVIGE